MLNNCLNLYIYSQYIVNEFYLPILLLILYNIIILNGFKIVFTK